MSMLGTKLVINSKGTVTNSVYILVKQIIK